MISVTLQGDNWFDISTQMRLMLNDAPLIGAEPESRAAFPDGNGADDDEDRAVEEIIRDAEETIAAPQPAKPKRSHKKAATPAQASPPPAPEPEPLEPEAAPEPDAPTLDALKQIVTKAVRAAQKGEGPKKILDLLPEFKAKTKLDFVMNADEPHYAALNDLIVQAGLAAV